MDSQKRDESRERRREEALARRMGAALDRLSPRVAGEGTGECPDAELIAAYHERVLEPDELSRCESHFSACPRCRKILAVLAVSADTPLAEKEVTHLGELIAAAPSPHEATPHRAKPTRPNWLDWRVRWLAPALGVAAVLAVWFAIRPPWRTIDQGSSGTLIAQAPKKESLPNAEVPSVDQFSKESPATRLEPESSTPSATSAKKSLDDMRAIGGLPSAGVAGSSPGDEKNEKADADSAAAGAPPPAPMAALRGPLAQAQSNSSGQAAPPAPEAPASTSQSVTVTGAAPAASGTGGGVFGGLAGNALTRDRPVNGRNFQAISRQAEGETFIVTAQPPSTAIAGPSPDFVMWRAGKGGSIEYSENTGRTWRAQASPVHDDWLAGAPVSKTTCWLVGRNGVIAQTIDAENWERIAPPPMSADSSGKFPDWIAVTASDAQTATITASDQRRFATQDGGKTWQAQ